jgi:hypothetical protein
MRQAKFILALQVGFINTGLEGSILIKEQQQTAMRIL